MRKKEQIELTRHNVTPAQFFAYVRHQIKKHNFSSISADDIEFEYWKNGGDLEFDYHDVPGKPCKAEKSISQPYKMQTYILNWDGTVYNLIAEFEFDDEKMGWGYFFFINTWDEKESEEKEMKEEKTITRTITMSEENWEHCKNIADELEELVNGDFVNVDGEAVEVQEDEDGNEFVTVDGEKVDADEYEQYSLYNYFSDCFDIKYTVNSDLEYSGVSVMVACGGPNIYIDTVQKKVLLYWWTDYAEYDLASEVVDEIDAVFSEFYEMKRH